MISWQIGQRVWYIGNDIGPAIISGVITASDTINYRYQINGVWVSGFKLSR
jgi:hypothetical protein